MCLRARVVFGFHARIRYPDVSVYINAYVMVDLGTGKYHVTYAIVKKQVARGGYCTRARIRQCSRPEIFAPGHICNASVLKTTRPSHTSAPCTRV